MSRVVDTHHSRSRREIPRKSLGPGQSAPRLRRWAPRPGRSSPKGIVSHIMDTRKPRSSAPSWLLPILDASDVAWPMPALPAVPTRAVALYLADWVRERLPSKAPASELATLLRIPVKLKSLRRTSTRLHALLVPDRTDRFIIICNSSGGDVLSPQQQFRVGHELAHTLFYDWSTPIPRRTMSCTEAEEHFCDAFARRLMARQKRLTTDSAER